MAIPVDVIDDAIMEESIIIDVTKSSFFERSNDFIQQVSKSSWIAIDEEMTGIRLPRGLDTFISKENPPEHRYSSFKKVAERYSIMQLGISLFQEMPEASGKFHVRRYKFTTFPAADASTEVTLSPSSIKFLAENNCDFNSWVKEGIPFCTEELASSFLEKFRSDEVKKMENESSPSNIMSYNQRKKVVLSRPEDKDFHSKALASLREWLDSVAVRNPGDEEGVSFLLPPCNSFLRRALYEAIESVYGNLLVVETLKATSQIKVWRLDPEERKMRNQRLRRKEFETLFNEKIGTWRIFLALALACNGGVVKSQAEHVAMSTNVDDALKPWIMTDETKIEKRKIPLVVHNGMQDLLFLMTHFHKSVLPESWFECKALIHSYFPVIYDTKLMATEYCSRDSFQGCTRLDALYDYSIREYPQWKRIFTHVSSSSMEEQAHDAGYDSYCTGVAFYALSMLICEEFNASNPEADASPLFVWSECHDVDEVRSRFGRNKLYFFGSPYTIDLEEAHQDPLSRGMSHDSTFVVDGIDSAVSTRDIIHCLSGLTDSSQRPVQFDILWINDIKFMVGAMQNPEEGSNVYPEHGRIIMKALKDRFSPARVYPLSAAHASEETPSVWNLWGLLSKSHDTHEDTGRRAKRRRIA